MQLTSFAWPGLVWKWRPRSVPRADREWFTPGVGAERLGQEAALVAVRLRLDQEEAVQLRIDAARHQPRARPYCRS
jgi:hypothetical protein